MREKIVFGLCILMGLGIAIVADVLRLCQPMAENAGKAYKACIDAGASQLG